MLRQAVIESVENVVREAGVLARDAMQRQSDAERLLRHLREGVLLSDLSYVPDARPLGERHNAAAVRAESVIRLCVAIEEASGVPSSGGVHNTGL